MTKVFISYSHDSQPHRDFVRGMADRLCNDGLDCEIDQYINGSPSEGWLRWMEDRAEEADFVLMICTETYLRRYRGHETNRSKGKGVTFEGVVISQTLYNNYYQNTKFVPVLPEGGNFRNVPVPLQAFKAYTLPADYDNLYRFLTKQPEHLKPAIGKQRVMPPVNAQTSTTRIHSDRLPTVKGDFFGREAELKMLTEAWQEDNSIRIMQFIAPGGTGKTKLLRHWLDHTDGIDALIAWSFYSQGASEDKQTSASPFFSHIFKKLGATRTDFDNDEDKGEYLADLLCGRRCVLVLDGLEPMQYADNANRGELKDRALRALLKSLSGRNTGLCIITTRIAVHELSDRDAACVISHNLENLTPADGVKLLQSLGVKGRSAELNKAVNEYGRHALALNLLGNVLRLRYEGDVQKRDTLKALVKSGGNKESRHAFKVMQTYAEWFNGEPELDLLHLLGLFDHPIEQKVLQVLWDAQIPNLTEGIDEDEWLEAITRLREEHQLLSQHNDSNDLDCHPLIREYFGKQLKGQQPNSWKQAHETLYHYYKNLPRKELPDTLEEMQPLFSAVAHGCAAGLQLQVFHDVYWLRIRRKGEAYIVYKLAAFSDNLATISHFFTTPWHAPASGLTDSVKAIALNIVGFSLRALGRLREALEPMQAAVSLYEKLENWKEAALNASNLSELQLTLGDIAQAEQSGQRSMDYANQSGDLFHLMSKRATHADALHQAGETTRALALFREAEKLQQKYQPEYPLMYSLRGFRYCDLLLAQSSEDKSMVEEVLVRAEQTLEWAKKQGAFLLAIALDQHTLGRAHLQQRDFPKATQSLNQAVTGLRAAGSQPHLPRGLLARATLHRHTQNFTLAHKDLQEVHEIAEPSGMRLHLTDYHLEMARLLLAEQASEDVIQHHIQAATQLIEATGYKRRLPELKALRLSIA